MTAFGGRLSSLLTNYDITFWLLLASALDQQPPAEVESRPCTALPMRNVAVRPIGESVAQTLASLNLVLLEAKASDDRQDGSWVKAGVVRLMYRTKFTRAREYLLNRGFPLESIDGLPAHQARVERQANPTFYSLSEPTSRALGEVFSSISILHNQPEIAEQLRDFGATLGRYLYLWDALQDQADDIKSGNFNAVRAVEGGVHQVGTQLHSDILHLQRLLDQFALGPEGKLCKQLLKSLESQLRRQHSCVVRRPGLRKAGFVQASSCGGGDGETDCCNCGCCDCNICGSPGESKGCQCCEYNLCGGSSTFSCCCCDGSENARRHRTCSACHYTDGGEDFFAEPTESCDLSSCFTKQNKEFRASGPSSISCPCCEIPMLKLHLGKIEFEECRNCGGFWLSHSIIEELCKLSKLPENLLLRYPSDKLPKTKPTGQRSCSQCNDSVLVSIHSLEVPTEICKTCKGLWLEHGQLKKILKAQKSESVQATSQPWSCAQCQSLNMSTRDQCSKCQGACPSGI